jgi:undecaprenyl-diphosphatase
VTDIGPVQAVVYGIVQGLTEFLPISSSGHLRLVQQWLNPNIDEAGFTAFTAVIQLGTVVAVVMYFWRELVHVAVAWARGLLSYVRSGDGSERKTLEYRLGWYLVLATIPVAVFGLLFSGPIETGARNLWLIAISLIVVGAIMAVAEKIGRRDRDEEELNITDAVTVGVAQSLALIPGVSRSGVTITAGLFRGLDRVTAARFSFLLSIPAVVLSGLFEARKIGGSQAPGMGVTVVATIVSFVVGLASIAWLIRYLSRHSMFVFVGYRFVLGAVVIGLLASGTVPAS